MRERNKKKQKEFLRKYLEEKEMKNTEEYIYEKICEIGIYQVRRNDEYEKK
jgi:hypothetical protein